MTADAVGGVWTYAVELCRVLTQRNVEVLLAVMGQAPSPAQREEVGVLSGVSLHARAFRLEWMDEPWDDVRAAGEWLLELADRFEPDLVHLNGYCHAALPWRAPCLVVGHSCVLSWWRAVKGEPAPAQWDRYRHEVSGGIRQATAVVAPSRTMLTWLDELYGPLPDARVIANGRARPATSPDDGVKEPLVLAVGRLWDEAKNVSALVDVADELSWPVVIAGALDPARAAALNGRVRYLGQLPSADVQAWMARASIYALPARYEPFGLSVLEAALARCALVLGDVPTLRDIWGDAAVYVPPGDRQALTHALVELTCDEARRRDLGERARCLAAVLTPERMADGYCALYAELVHERRPLLPLGSV